MRPQKNRGGTLKETVLWNNSAPTSGMTSTTITLSQSIDLYDYIKIVWRVSKTVSTEMSMLTTPSSIKISTSGGTNVNNLSISARPTSGRATSRLITYSSVTKLGVSVAHYIGESGNTTDYAIPIQIVGIKLG